MPGCAYKFLVYKEHVYKQVLKRCVLKYSTYKYIFALGLLGRKGSLSSMYVFVFEYSTRHDLADCRVNICEVATGVVGLKWLN